jgi:hypothetical protein
MNEHRQ